MIDFDNSNVPPSQQTYCSRCGRPLVDGLCTSCDRDQAPGGYRPTTPLPGTGSEPSASLSSLSAGSTAGGTVQIASGLIDASNVIEPLVAAKLVRAGQKPIHVDLMSENETFTIGRDHARCDECDAVLTDQLVSRAHMTIRVFDGAPYAEDLGSTNGTYVNGVRIEGPTLLRDSDTLRVGNTEFVFRDA